MAPDGDESMKMDNLVSFFRVFAVDNWRICLIPAISRDNRQVCPISMGISRDNRRMTC